MKKILLTLLLALPFCMVAKAQDFRVGITGGYNLSSPSGYKSQSGFHVGVINGSSKWGKNMADNRIRFVILIT